MNPDRVLLCGDTHGDPQHLLYLYERALEEQCQALVILGDYGYWEHHPDGWAWLEANRDLAEQTGIPTCWLDGNHENHPLLWDKYADAPRNAEGFWEIREGVYYMPRGHRWSWNGFHFLSLGGAASIDRYKRIKEFNEARKKLAKGESSAHLQNWWRTEEITDADVRRALTHSSPVDIMLTHDKPRAVDIGLKDHPLLVGNQDKVQTVIRKLQPRLVVHGHLHHRYTQEIRIGDGRYCRVEGLAHNDAENPTDSWEVLDLGRSLRG